MPRLSWFASLLVLGCGLAGAVRAAPVVHCVGTVQELRNAVAASNATWQAFDLRIRSGCYALTQDGSHTHAPRFCRHSYDFAPPEHRSFRISGAWNAGCTQQAEQVTAVNSTVLDGQDAVGVFLFMGLSATNPISQIAENAHPAGAVATDLFADGTTFVRNNRLVHVVGDLGSLPFLLHNTQVAPGFLNAWNPRLSLGSALRDLGHTAAHHPGVGSRDVDGNVRVQGAAVDIGAHELEPLAPPPVDAVFANGFD